MSQKETFYITTQFITQVGSYILGIHIQQSRCNGPLQAFNGF